MPNSINVIVRKNQPYKLQIIRRQQMGTNESQIIINPEVDIIYRECKKTLPSRISVQSNKRVKKLLKQLLQMFPIQKNAYLWSKQIQHYFFTYFFDGFEQYWLKQKEQFYSLLLQYCQVKKNSPQMNFQEYFYEVAPKKVREGKQNHEPLKFQELELQVMNSSILREQNQDYSFIYQKSLAKQRPLSDFYVVDLQQKPQIAFKSQYNPRQIDVTSIIIPQTVFYERLEQKEQSDVQQYIEFYKKFSDTLHQMINRLIMLSCPIKHFQICLKQKIKKKKIKKSFSMNVRRGFDDEFLKKRKEHNNHLLLKQFKDFIQAYTDFLWKFLELYRMGETQYGQFINFETVQGIILKNVWNFTSWIGERGFEWEQLELKNVVKCWKVNQDLKIPDYIIQQCQNLTKQENPQKYLKKVVIIYRQLSKLCQNADSLLHYLERLLQICIKKGYYHRLFKMQNIISKILTIPENNGEIAYAWVSWNIVLEMLKELINKNKQILKLRKTE